MSRKLLVNDPDYLAGNPLLGPNQCPDLPDFVPAMAAYYEATFNIGRMLLRGFALAFEEPIGSFDTPLTKPPSQLRLSLYPHNQHAQDKLGLGAHIDYDFFTLRATAPGMKVLNSAGEWIDIPPQPDAYVVYIGYMLELWTNCAFIATTHSVRKVMEERFFFPLFFSVDNDTGVAPLPRFVTAQRPDLTALMAASIFSRRRRTLSCIKSSGRSGVISNCRSVPWGWILSGRQKSWRLFHKYRRKTLAWPPG